MTRKLKQLRASVIAALSAASLTLAACDDSPLAPEQAVPEVSAVSQQAVAAAAANDVAGRGVRPDASSVAIRDAIERVLPTFEPGNSRTTLGAGLTQALALLERKDLAGARQVLKALGQPLDAYERQASKARGPDIDAVRLAIATGL